MKITFQFYAQLRAAAGAESEALELPEGIDLPAAVAALAGRHGPEFRAIALDDAGRLRPSLIALVNDLPAGRGEGRTLHDGDTVALLSAVAGG